MIDSKKLNIISSVLITAAVAAVVLMIIFGREYTYTPEYAKTVFGADIITVDIQADETEWQNMLDNAINEEYIMADVAVNGKKYSYVGIRPKGNNSLQQVYSSDSDRYSFKIKFDEYAAGQTCGGLDMLVLNDMLGDATYMKEYTTFEMMRELGIETPYFGYAKITVNGEDWGLYFALEAYNDSYKQRVSGNENGTLYNVKSTDMGGQGKPEQGGGPENIQSQDFGGRGGFGGHGGMGAANSGGSLVYTDDEVSSYPAIFGNVVGDGDEEDFSKIISALKALSEGENIEEYFDVDEILRYLAVHTFVVNLDSYSSNMAQNYYIYEQDGTIQILPWDYNYAWGAFQGGTASAAVNFPIDTPVSGVEMSERPLISVLFGNEEYFERYHSYLNELLEKYFTDSKFNNRIDELDNLIGSYVKNDPTAFYTYDEYKTALEAFKNMANLRAESVSLQLSGEVPSTTEEQKNFSDKLVDASSVTMSELGTSGMGGDRDFGDRNFGDRAFGERPDFDMGDGRDFSGEPPQFDENNVPPDFPEGDIPDNNTDSNDVQASPNLPNGNNAEENTYSNIQNNPPDFSTGENNVPQGGRDFGQRSDNVPQAPQGETVSQGSGMALNIVSLILLVIAIIGVSLVKGKF